MHTTIDTIQEQEKTRDARMFEYQMESFWKRWAPDDKYEAAQFQAELSVLIRQVYADAQAPLLEYITKLSSIMPFFPPKG